MPQENRFPPYPSEISRAKKPAIIHNDFLHFQCKKWHARYDDKSLTDTKKQQQTVLEQTSEKEEISLNGTHQKVFHMIQKHFVPGD